MSEKIPSPDQNKVYEGKTLREWQEKLAELNSQFDQFESIIQRIDEQMRTGKDIPEGLEGERQKAIEEKDILGTSIVVVEEILSREFGIGTTVTQELDAVIKAGTTKPEDRN